MDNLSPTSSTQLRGRVVRFAKVKNFGWLDPEEGEPLYFHGSDCAPEYQHVHTGDDVAYDYDENDGQPCARNIHFLGNRSLDALRADFERGAVLFGFIKKIEGEYYVKDVETHIFSKLAISLNEVDVDEIYEASLNQKRAYRLVRMSAHNALRAVLEERRFRPGLADLVAGQTYAAEVLFETKGGYQLYLPELDIKGFLPCKDTYKQTIPLPIGGQVEVELAPAAPNSRYENLMLELAGDSRDLLSPATLAAWQARQLAAIGPGFSGTATVKRVLNFGAFVIFAGYGDALLHIKTLVDPQLPANTSQQKQALGDLLAELLPPKTEVTVVVLDVEGDRCSVGLDMQDPANVALKEEFVRRQRQLLG